MSRRTRFVLLVVLDFLVIPPCFSGCKDMPAKAPTEEEIVKGELTTCVVLAHSRAEADDCARDVWAHHGGAP